VIRWNPLERGADWRATGAEFGLLLCVGGRRGIEQFVKRARRLRLIELETPAL